MPDGTGFDVLAHVRQSVLNASVPVIAVTGESTSQHKGSIADAKFAAHLVKPLDPASFVPLVLGIKIPDRARDAYPASRQAGMKAVERAYGLRDHYGLVRHAERLFQVANRMQDVETSALLHKIIEWGDIGGWEDVLPHIQALQSIDPGRS